MGTLLRVSRLHILSIAALATLCFGWLLTGRFPWAAAAVCALDWFLVNLINRIADLAEDRENRVAGTDFVERHARALTAASWTLLVGSLAALHLAVPQLTPLRLAFQAIGLAYNYRLLPSPRGWRRLKEAYLLKNTSSAALFLLSCLAYPSALHGWAVPFSRALWLAAFFFPLELTYEIIYDLRDVEGDRAGRVPTLPVAHGEKASHLVVEALITLSALALVSGWAAGQLRLRELLLVAAPLQQLLFFELRAKRRVTQRDAVLLTWLGAGQVLSYCVWAGAGLPLGPG